ncbi:Cytochrome oxidase assembly protein shy1 [Neolecta irregularis DAH-3]|uniref:SURF1-like protein n=1 Tax=Neolecta irregularis (strain DAH-3) TaxID=1198029 RepID=A0A1U7LKG3_NEOID|nr:Cytochrome oxidase assembly protein shy1 [Neolecta irregularis DAH-3]|eukprot:OLL23083.1 Cytochrome oxidase assembly protein shy1 [Neolecta irregularis DAH-3]
MPVCSMALGTWQVYRHRWKSDLIEKYTSRLNMKPILCPDDLDPEHARENWDHRKVLVKGKWRHDLEMLVGIRTRDGRGGFHVITPLQRQDGSKVLVNRGWIASKFRDQESRKLGLPEDEVVVHALVRPHPRKNIFTPENKPHEDKFYFTDVPQMVELTMSKPIYLENIIEDDDFKADMDAKCGIPIGRNPTINLSNNHLSYIFTWYALAGATSLMLYFLLRKPKNPIQAKIYRTE